MFVVASALDWLDDAIRLRTRVAADGSSRTRCAPPRRPDLAIFLLVLPDGAYVYGALALGWGFNELSAGFFVAA